MGPDDPALTIARLEAKIDNLASVVDLRMRSLDQKVLDREATTAQTLTALTEVLRELSSNVQSTYVRRDVYAGEHAVVVTRLGKVEGNQSWLAKTAVTGAALPFLIAIMAAIYMAGIR